MSLKTWLTSSIRGSGPTASASRRLVSQLFSAAASTRVCRACSQHTPLSTISVPWRLSTSWTATPATTARLLLPTSTPEINIREITQNGRYWQDGEWVVTKPLEFHRPLTYPNIGPRESYLLYHEELESLVQNFPTIKRARFWMTFGQEYLTHLRVIQDIGMARIDEVEYNGVKIVPCSFSRPSSQSSGPRQELPRRDLDWLSHSGCRQGW